MMHPTHKLVGGSSGFVLAAAVTLVTSEPLYVEVLAVALAVPTAAASSSIPDDLEGILHLPHRKLTHYPLIQVLVMSLVAVGIIHFTTLPPVLIAVLAGAVAFGCLMHSCVDAMTIDSRGIQLLWPISRRGYHLLPRRMRVQVGTKSRSEMVFAVAWSALMAAIVLSYLYARFRHHIVA